MLLSSHVSHEEDEKKKLADHELTMTLRSEAVANVCEKTKTFVKIYSELRLFLEEGSC